MITPTHYKNKKVAVFGLGKAGTSTINALLRADAKIYAFDDKQESVQKLSDNNQNIKAEALDKTNWQEIDSLILSPGVPFTHPKPHQIVTYATNAKVPIICDIEALYQSQNAANFIGITGTNGKSTTTTLIDHILKHAGKKVATGGNLGIPALDLEALDKTGFYVLEMSSYQLDLIDRTRFNVSILLNITPDHLDRHGDMAGYSKAKCRIFKNQTKQDFAIVSIDDSYCKNIYQDLVNEGKIGDVIAISTQKILNPGISVRNGIIYDNQFGNDQYNLGELERLPGEHNAQNIAAAYAAAKAINISSDVIIEAIKTFQGLRHRIQLVRQIGAVKFINDSKATNAEATQNALKAFDNIYWILGGLAKEGGIESLSPYFPKIKHAFLIGKAEDDFAKTLEGKVNYNKSGTLAQAFSEAASMALKNPAEKSVVLLSPACASWDQWPNFEVRGDAFCKMAEEYTC